MKVPSADMVIQHFKWPRFNSRLLGNITLPITPTPASAHFRDANVTILTIQRTTTNTFGWAFHSRPAMISISNNVMHQWDFRTTFKGNLSNRYRTVPLGVRCFNQHDRPLTTYLGLAQTYFHVAISLERFKEALLDQMTFETGTDEEWDTLQELRVSPLDALLVSLRAPFPFRPPTHVIVVLSSRRTSSGNCVHMQIRSLHMNLTRR